MKKLAAPAILVLSLTLVGCVQTHMDTVIKKDGSGTFTMSYAMSAEMAAALQELSEMNLPGQDQQDAPTIDDFNREELEKTCKQHNVKLKKCERTTVEEKDRVDVVMEFQDIKDLSGALNSTLSGQGALGIFKIADGNYTLRAIELELEPEEAAVDVEFGSVGQRVSLSASLPR